MTQAEIGDARSTPEGIRSVETLLLRLVELDFKYELCEAMDYAGFRQLSREYLQILLPHAMLEACRRLPFPVELPRNDDVGETLIEERLAPRSSVIDSACCQLRFRGKASRPIVKGLSQTAERRPCAPRLTV